MTIDDRFVGSTSPPGSRTRLCFQSELSRLGELRTRWAFVDEPILRSNIASTLQDVHFDVLLLNNYEVYLAPEAMKLKHCLVQVASVIEAALQHLLKPIEGDPRIARITRSDWAWVDFRPLSLPGVEIPANQRAVAGLQRRVDRERLDNNTKMDFLVRAAVAVEIVDEAMAEELHELRKARNRIHIKTIEARDHDHYTVVLANDALGLLERFRQVAEVWARSNRGSPTSNRRSPVRVPDVAVSTPGHEKSAPTPWSVGEWVEHAVLGIGELTAVNATDSGTVLTVDFRDDGSTRRFLDGYAPMTRIAPPLVDDSDIPF
jgi:hypothetical protein